MAAPFGACLKRPKVLLGKHRRGSSRVDRAVGVMALRLRLGVNHLRSVALSAGDVAGDAVGADVPAESKPQFDY